MKEKNKIRIKISSPTNLSAFFKKLKSIEKGAIIEMKGNALYSKVHTPDKSVIKFIQVPIESVFEIDLNKALVEMGFKEDTVLKMGFLDVGKAIDIYKNFKSEDEIYWTVTFSKNEGELIASEIVIGSSKLSIKLRCADLILLSYVEDSIIKNVHSIDNALLKAPLYKSDMTTIGSLCSFDGSDPRNLLKFIANSNKLEAIGGSFNYQLSITEDEIEYNNEEPEYNFSFFQKQFAFIDDENSMIYLHDSRIIIKSNESLTTVAISTIED